MERWSTGVMGAKEKKSDLYSFAIVSCRRQKRFIFLLLQYSITPSLQIQFTSAFDKKADNCSLPTAVI
jgi:hypothetical protein